MDDASRRSLDDCYDEAVRLRRERRTSLLGQVVNQHDRTFEAAERIIVGHPARTPSPTFRATSRAAR